VSRPTHNSLRYTTVFSLLRDEAEIVPVQTETAVFSYSWWTQLLQTHWSALLLTHTHTHWSWMQRPEEKTTWQIQSA